MCRGQDLPPGLEYSVEEFLLVLEESWWLFGCQRRDLVSQTVSHTKDEHCEMRLLILWEE